MQLPNDSQLVPWNVSSREILNALESSEAGLSSADAQKRLAQYGTNELPRERRFHLVRILLRQFASPLIILLLIAGTVTALLHEWRDSIAIFAAVVLNAALGLYQELKAERALSALETYAKEYALVSRDGTFRRIESRFLVPGDVVRVQHGNRVPADGRVIAVTDGEIDESILTGESLPVAKTVDSVGAETHVADRINMAFMGTTIVEGSVDIIVTKTGAQTELGKIATAVRSVRQEATPLQRSLTKFTWQVSALVVMLACGLFVFGITNGMTAYSMFMLSVAVAVSAVPEGLPIALTVILAIGVERMAKKKGIIRNLLAAETLGSTTVVMTDKTGTLTEARMRLSNVVPVGDFNTEALMRCMVMHSDAVVENPQDPVADWTIVARPIEAAVIRAAGEQGLLQSEVLSGYDVIERLPFSSSRKYSAILLEKKGERTAIVFGAPETVLGVTNVSDIESLMETVNTAAHNGERVLGIAIGSYTHNEQTLDMGIAQKSLLFGGLVMFRDPVRASVPDAIQRIETAGVRVIIVTGDHPGTARSVARELGWEVEEANILTGDTIASMSDAALLEALPRIRVIARVAPEQKLRIARLLRQSGEVVGMTGDGVNDAPALREADIGIAVGSGSDVAKASGDLILLDNNFETIVLAIEEGRKVLQNMRKVIAYLMSSVFDELVLVAGSIVLGIALPLSALQILWVNLVIGALPGVALAFESQASDIGKRPIRLRGRLLDKELRFIIFGIGTLTSIVLLGLYYLLLRFGFAEDVVRSFIFAAFSAYALFLVFSVRSLQTSIYSYPLFSNRYLVGAVIVGFVASAAALYVPALQRVLGTVPLSPLWLLGVLLFGLFSIVLVEIAKRIFRSVQ